ncbi:DUF4935 domain-containing protein [Massilia sp. RP-1-19]|uniref:DUF4935 domain-containing protein n=1 Tax=Massilia polaris TaxID=2728846 RepID=A0A848HNN4_9BURK|nr:PIN domain-containing protein [Massilia polaris]NML61421.1 DUF4935 domain-containing protein [Massilia polaris]
MDVFHLVIDTSMLRRFPFQHPDFQRLLRQCQMGSLKLYIPHIALEEERTAQLAKHVEYVEKMKLLFDKLQRGMQGMLVEGLPEPHLDLWDVDEVARNSQTTFNRFVATNKIEVIEISMEHAANAWTRYFNVDLPFSPAEEREQRRKDIPDSWILEAGIEIKNRKGHRCALVGDNKLAEAFKKEGFKVYREVETLLNDIELATAVIAIRPPVVEEVAVPLHQLRSPSFKEMDIIVLGLIEALNTPSKDELFSTLENAGFDRAIAEHEARTLVLSGRLNDTGTHLIPTSRALAQQAAGTEVVISVLLKVAL